MLIRSKKVIGVYAINDLSDRDFPHLIHDHSIALFDGKDLEFLQLERWSRIKYHAQLPVYIDSLEKQKLFSSFSDKVLVYTNHELGDAFISSTGRYRGEASMPDKLTSGLHSSRAYWNGTEVEAYCVNHELAHVFSCLPFYGSFKENSLLIHYDGGASKSNFSAWIYKKGALKLIDYHNKLKRLTALFNANALTFAMVGGGLKDQNGVPGKFMGLASFGSYDPEIENWLETHDYFKDIWGDKTPFFAALKQKFGVVLSHFDLKNEMLQNIAATIHEVFVRESMKEFEQYVLKYKPAYLYYSGGVALNIKMNKRLMDTGWFNEIFIPPCPNDSGLSIGAVSAYCYFNTIEQTWDTPYLNNIGIKEYAQYIYTNETIEKTAEIIAKGQVLGICNGYGEIGPRALGNRSIIARGDSVELAQRVSQKHKGREWYRPVAPVVLAENFGFFTGEGKIPAAAKYMLFDFTIEKNAKPAMKGCVHVDGTARMQVIENKEQNPFMFDLLTFLDAHYQIKALVNTSFNRKGEPIVHTTENARKSAKIMKLDYVVLNGILEKV